MPLQFPARYSTELSSELRDTELLQAVAVKTIRDCSWTVDQMVADKVTASTSFNLRSSGESIEVDVLSPSSLRITSKCAMPTQCFDWGKNRKNVEEFAGYFQTNAIVASETGQCSTIRGLAEGFFDNGEIGPASVRKASTEQGSCRFELLVDDSANCVLKVVPREGIRATRKPKRRSGHRSFSLTVGSKAATYKFTPRRVSVPLESVSEILVQNGTQPSSGCGRFIAFVMLALVLPPIGLIIAVYWSQKTGKGTPPSVTFFFDGKTGNKEIDEYGMKSIDLEDDNVAFAVSQFISTNTSIPVKYQ